MSESDFTFHVPLTENHWYTVNPDDPNRIRSGYDFGGEVLLHPKIVQGIKTQEAFSGNFKIARRASKSIFGANIIVKNEVLPAHLISPEMIGSLARGIQYDVFISFNTKDEALLFKLCFPDNFDVDFGGGV